MSKDKAPDLIEPFTAWKGLLADEEGGLWSPSLLTLWPVGKPLKAKCDNHAGSRKSDHKPPHVGCMCGIYGVKTYEDLKKDHYHWGGPANVHTVGNDLHKVWVLAEIALYGTVRRGRIGYRASLAAPQAVYVPATSIRLGGVIRKRYGVDLGTIDRFTGKRTFVAGRRS